ncbi:Superfamily I DNA and RNA helicase-like protein [Stackebrandtia nassauensis DSM 44728]|uniref:Superfamily I DNA and RNA helicase-like protein n=1 Tax=Stackebrandtia nassauensis (strain DSM 44728 / CIP 108903 / NRRL B-16338 / NBRC 102104 / LLR-40K-21) TaxID=446470 RepID=D3Q4B5_STANL|nr:UvrD-helicase domain-containing protein [Stackebrandtia nassauensis]ADD40075.1 Superfamily I DNA and RNA helicase-like protein [Stackebrandtia nassauensis DSM 44728]
MNSEPQALFELPVGARVPRPSRESSRPRTATVARLVPMPEPLLPARPEPIIQDGPCLAGMEEVGTGLLDHADAMQRVAASAPPGPLLINAGPGTGKTHVLVRRIAYHIEELHIPASQCLVLTAGSPDTVRTDLAELIGSHCDEITIAAFGDIQIRDVPALGHLFVDDIHRMSPKLYDALRADRGAQPAFTATGDPDSALHDGPSPFESFPSDYPDARVVRLTRNYRSTAPIIAAAMQLITPVTRAPGRTMLPERPAATTAPIGRYFAPADAAERDFAANLPATLAASGIDAADVMVLRPGGGEIAGVPSLSIAESAGRQFRAVCLLGVTAKNFPDTPAARRALFTAMTRAGDLLYLSHSGAASPLLNGIDAGLFSAFGRVAVRSPRVEQPRLL